MYSLMANCFACIKKRQEPAKKVTLVLVGLDNAGKTTAIKGVQGENNSEEPPTVGFSSIEFTFEKKFEVTVYDLGGGKKIRDIWKDYYAEVHGVVFVLDASDEDRIDECRQALKDTLNHHRIHGKRILVLANKQDVDGALDEVDICEQLELEDLVNESKCPCRVETCTAIQGFGKKMDKAIYQGFKWLLYGMADDWEKLSERVDKEFAEQKEAARKYKRERLEQIRKQKEEREKKEKEERKKNGVEESDDEDVLVGDPFKKVDDDYFEDIKNKKKKKKVDKGKKDDDEPVKKSKGKSPRLQVEMDESQETERTKNNGSIVIDKPRTKKGKKKSLREEENHAFENQDSGDNGVDKKNKKNSKATELNSDSEAEIVASKKKKKKQTKKTLANDGEDVQLSSTSPKDLSANKSSQLELSQDEDASNVKKKKKKKKFKKNNKTAPMPVEGIDEGNTPGPLGSPSWANPGGQRNIFIKASKQPSLEPLMEGNAQKLKPISSSNSNSNSNLEPIKSTSNHSWSLDLPEMPTRRKPNTDDDDDIVV